MLLRRLANPLSCIDIMNGTRDIEPQTTSPITDARLQQAFDYWLGKRAGRRMPRRADLDPIDIPRLLPHVMLTEVVGPRRFRYRLIGTEIQLAQGIHATGRFVDEVLKGDEYKPYVLDLYDEIVRECRPCYTESIFLSLQDGATERYTKRLMLPLSDDDSTVNIIMVVQVFFYIDQNTRNRHFIDARPHKETLHVLL
jgi:hypothetical protein